MQNGRRVNILNKKEKLELIESIIHDLLEIERDDFEQYCLLGVAIDNIEIVRDIIRKEREEDNG